MADRSVSISLRAKVGDFVTNMRTAKATTQDLSRQMTETGASADRMRQRLEAATKALPKIKIDADSSAAEVKFAQLRRDLESLSGKRIGVDIDAGAAIAEAQRIERELAQLERTEVDVNVRADIGTALAELRAMQGEVNRLNGESARVKVDADVSGALANIALVGAALHALPAAVTIGAGIAGLGAAFSAAGAGAAAFGAVAIPAMGRVNEAVKEMGKATGGAGGATRSLAQQQAQAAARALQLAQAQDRVKDALREVRDAQRDVTRAQRDLGAAQADVSRAVEDAASRHAEALRRVADAERAVRDAQADALRAQQDLNDARREAARDLEDLGNRLIDTNLDLKGAQLDLTDAQAELNKVMADPKATAAQKERAQLNYDRAVQRVKELQLALERLRAEQAQADKDGVDGSKKVKDAKDALADANQRIADAQRNLADAQRDSAKVDQENARRIADAQQAVIEAHEKVAEAQRKVADAQRDAMRAAQALKVQQLQAKAAMEQAGGAAGGAASKFGELSKREQQMAKDLKKFQDGYVEWQRSLERDVFPAISGGLNLVQLQLPRISPLVRSAAGAFVDLERDATKALNKPIFDKLLWDLNTQIPGAIDGLGNSFLNIGTGLAGVLDAFLPFAPTMVGGIEEVTQRFAEWGSELQNSPEFHEFVAFVKENAPQVWELIKNIAGAGKDIVKALAPLGVGSLSGLNLLAEIVRGMDPEHIRLIALGILAVKAAQSGMKVAAFWGDLSGKVGELNGKFSGLKGTLKGSGIALAITGLAAGSAELREQLTGLNPDIDKLARSMVAFVDGGKPAPELLDQLNGKASAIDLSRWESFGDIASRLTSDNTFAKLGGQINDAFAGVTGVNLDSAVTRMQNIDQALAKAVTSGHGAEAAKMFQQLAKMAGDAGVPVDKLKGLLPEYTSAVAATTQPTNDAAGAIGNAKGKLDEFSTALGVFSGRTDAVAALQKIKDAYNDARDAIDAASGKLDINARMTDAQKDAVVRAREQFATYLQRVKDGADAQATLTGKTSDGTRTILEQLPKMADLAGSNKEAKRQVLLLADAYGISREDALKAMEGGKKLQQVLDKLKSKQIRIDMETKAAEDKLKRLWEWQQKILGINKELPKGIAAPKTKSADGDLFKPFAGGGIALAGGGLVHIAGRTIRHLGDVHHYAAGGVERRAVPRLDRFAAGAEQHIAQIAPAGAWRVWAEPETGGEAYIPLAAGKRTRSTKILGAVADQFGYALVPADRLAVASAVPTAGAVMPGSASRSLPISGTGSGGTAPRRSAPQMGSPTYYAGPYAQQAAPGSLAGRLAHEATRGASGTSGSLVHVERMEVREQADIDMVAARLAMRVNARGGPPQGRAGGGEPWRRSRLVVVELGEPQPHLLGTPLLGVRSRVERPGRHLVAEAQEQLPLPPLP